MMEFMTCGKCGRHALALEGVGGEPVCIQCLDREDPYHHLACSAEGCVNRPSFMAVMRKGDASTVLMCERHLHEAGPAMTSYLPVPLWLVDAEGARRQETGGMYDGSEALTPVRAGAARQL